jgi:hypothetical protein
MIAPVAVGLLLLSRAGLFPAGAPRDLWSAEIRAHSHNDYQQAHPLWDAVANGYSSAEADVWWQAGEIVVAHLNGAVRHLERPTSSMPSHGARRPQPAFPL